MSGEVTVFVVTTFRSHAAVRSSAILLRMSADPWLLVLAALPGAGKNGPGKNGPGKNGPGKNGPEKTVR